MADVLERRPSGGLFSRASSSSSQSSASGKVNEFNLVARVKALAALRRVRSVSEQASHELQVCERISFESVQFASIAACLRLLFCVPSHQRERLLFCVPHHTHRERERERERDPLLMS